MTEAHATSFEAQEAQRAQEGAATDHSELTGAVAKVQAGLDARVEKIKGDESLDATERHIRIQQEWSKAANFHAELLKTYERQLEEKSADRERAVFHIGGRELQDSVRTAYNDVYDRTQMAFESGEAEGIQFAREELERLWERALRTNDRALQTAIGHLATERGDAKLRDEWLARSEEKSRAWERYVEARRKLADFQDPHRRFHNIVAGGFSLRKPPDLGGFG